jgi:hypothetical protein
MDGGSTWTSQSTAPGLIGLMTEMLYMALSN